MSSMIELPEEEYIFDEGIIISSTDVEGNILFVNKTFCEISGYTKEELIGFKHNIIRHHDAPDVIFANMWETLTKGFIWSGVIKNRKKIENTIGYIPK